MINIGNSTLERKKIDDCRFEYFILDYDANKIKDIDPKYFNCKQIGEIENFTEEVELNENGDEIINKYDTSFRYFEFSYNFITPEYTIIRRYDAQNDSFEHFFDNEYYDENDPNVEVIEAGNENIVLKAIINDAGDLIIDGVEKIIKFIPTIGATIIQLPYINNGKWENEYEKSIFNLIPNLWAVIDYKGEFIIQPDRAKIEFDEQLNIFEVGNILLYHSSGEKIGFKN